MSWIVMKTQIENPNLCSSYMIGIVGLWKDWIVTKISQYQIDRLNDSAMLEIQMEKQENLIQLRFGLYQVCIKQFEFAKNLHLAKW
jgi:hypothetical protein